MIEMLNLYFQYVIWLNRTLLDGIKWLITNKDAYYIIMCSVPIIATFIEFLTHHVIDNEMTIQERYEKIERAQKDDISKLLEIYSHEELKSMRERIEKEL